MYLVFSTLLYCFVPRQDPANHLSASQSSLHERPGWRQEPDLVGGVPGYAGRSLARGDHKAGVYIGHCDHYILSRANRHLAACHVHSLPMNTCVIRGPKKNAHFEFIPQMAFMI